MARLNDKQTRFVEEYCRDFNATQAAIRAGYSSDSARAIGCENLTKPNIAAAIAGRLKTLAMPADEAVKHLGDIARTRLNDFLQVVERQRPTEVRQPLAAAIAEAEATIRFEQEYARRAASALSSEEAAEAQATADGLERRLRKQILRWEMELEENAGAFRLVAGEPEIYQAVEVDMVGLAAAKDTGRIKAISFGEHGPKVETYAADAALVNILKMAGRFVERVEHSGEVKTVAVTIRRAPEGRRDE